MGDSLPFDSPADVPALPVTNVPTIPDTDNLPLLFSVPHFYLPPFLLRSRAATASFAIRLRSTADSLAALAFPPLLAILATWASDRFRARALPPRLPSACAFGLSFFPMPLLSCLALCKSREKTPASAVSSPAIPQAWDTPIRSGHTVPAVCRGCARPSECGRGCGSESKTRALSSGLPTLSNQSIRRGSRCCGTSLGHRLFLGSYFLPLRGVQRLH